MNLISIILQIFMSFFVSKLSVLKGIMMKIVCCLAKLFANYFELDKFDNTNKEGLWRLSSTVSLLIKRLVNLRKLV